MSLRNFHVNANVTDKELLTRSDGYFKKLFASFRQMGANGAFSFGGIKLQDGDLNRLHNIVTEIDSRRLFFACGEDEIPRHAMASLYEARRIIREASKGVWANPTCEVLVQEITAVLNDFCTSAEKFKPEELDAGSPDALLFMAYMTEMRLKVWLLVATIKKKVGSVIQPRNLPIELWDLVSTKDV